MNSATDPDDPDFRFEQDNDLEYFIERSGGFGQLDVEPLFDPFCPLEAAPAGHGTEESDKNEDYLAWPGTGEAEASGLHGSSSSSLFLGRRRHGRLRRKPLRISKVPKPAKKRSREPRPLAGAENCCEHRAMLFLESYIYSDRRDFEAMMPALPLADDGIALVKVFFREKIFKYSKASKLELRELYGETDEARFKELALKFHGSMGHQKMGNILRALFPKIVTYIMRLSSLDHVPMPDHDEFNGITYSAILARFGLTGKFLTCLNTPELKDYLNNISKEIFRSNCRAWASKLNQNPKADIRMGVIPADCEAALRVFAFQVRGCEG